MHCVSSLRRCDETVNGAGLDGRLLCSAVCGMERFGIERFGIYRRPGEDGKSNVSRVRVMGEKASHVFIRDAWC